MKVVYTLLISLLAISVSAQVGIGTTSPTSPLDIETSTSTTYIDLNNTAADGDPAINFQLNNTTTFSVGVNDGEADEFRIGTFDLEDAQTRFGIDASGNVGIGTVTYTAKLNVDGSAIFNESGAAVDFRVEGDTEANLLFVDASADLVGIGTSSPDELLHVSGASVGDGAHIGNAFVGVWDGNTDLAVFTHNTVKGTGTSYALLQASDGETFLNAASGQDLNLRINNVSAIKINSTRTLRFDAYGTGTLTTDASGNVTASSDERLKNIQGDFTRGLEDIQNINPITYKWKSSTGYDSINDYSGFSAQNVQKSIPEAIGVDERGYLTISDRPIVAALVNAVNEQQAIIEAQKKENESQKAEIESLKASTESKLSDLEAKLNTLLEKETALAE